MKYAGNLFYAQPFYSILCHLYNCLPLLRFSQCRLSFKQTTRANKVKYFYYLQEVFFGSSRCFCVSCCCSSAASSLSYILWQRANKLQRLNCLCLLLPSFSLSLSPSLIVCLVSMPASGFRFKQNTIRLMRVIYAIYPPYVCTWMFVFELLGGFAMNVSQKAGKLSAHFTFCFISRKRESERGGVSHRKSEIMRRS